MPIIGPDRGCQINFLPPRPSEVYPLTRLHQLPILENDRVNNLPTDQTFPSPELLLGTVTMAALQRRHFLKTNLSIKFPLSRRVEYGVEHHFIGLLEKVHRPPEYPKTPGLQVAHKVLLGIPFLKKTELIFILHALAKIAALASLLRPYGDDQ